MEYFLRMHHVGVAVSSIEQALPSYQEIFGYHLVSGPFHDPLQSVSVCFVARGAEKQVLVELIEPVGDKSPINRFLTQGVGAYHICYETDNINASLKHVRSKRCVIISEPVPAVAFDGRLIAWFYTPTRQLVELLQC